VSLSEVKEVTPFKGSFIFLARIDDQPVKIRIGRDLKESHKRPDVQLMLEGYHSGILRSVSVEIELLGISRSGDKQKKYYDRFHG